jgi:hypothetical protein
MSDKRFYALDQTAILSMPAIRSSTVRRERGRPMSITRREMPEGDQCSYVSVDGPEGTYPKWGGWYADDFIFSCRGE